MWTQTEIEKWERSLWQIRLSAAWYKRDYVGERTLKKSVLDWIWLLIELVRYMRSLIDFRCSIDTAVIMNPFSQRATGLTGSAGLTLIWIALGLGWSSSRCCDDLMLFGSCDCAPERFTAAGQLGLWHRKEAWCNQCVCVHVWNRLPKDCHEGTPYTKRSLIWSFCLVTLA